ncbi:uncharacterized serine-rich protein C215.13-like [Stegodyphus dumicola]|uniref:uncharacterized serine-rich protein C215.13-like n=1 Tax=Stegodyphus dumicola TaxID=202533 RepID=UPI0015B171E1|nr:uncharacterized serine-rich protein C215.13-like [Stegodyphus dumicola]
MSCNSQPRGLKRKHPEDEEDEDPPSTPNHPQLMYNQRRQEMLDLTYEKLCKFRQTPDSSLFRYVLIFNTMRNLEQELERDGIKVGGFTGGHFLPAVNHQVSTLDPPPNTNGVTDGIQSVSYPTNPYAIDIESRTATPSVINSSESPSDSIFGNVNGGTNYSSDYDRCLMDIDCPSSGRMTPFVRTPYERVESGALWTDDSDRLTSLNWSSVLNFNSGSPNTVNSPYSEAALDSSVISCNYDASSNSSSGCSDCSVSDDTVSGSETSLHTLMPAITLIPTSMNTVGAYSTSSSTSPNVSSVSGNTSPASGSSPTSSEDEIFGDVDLNLYDYDFMPLSPPNVKMAPISAEELMRSLSNDQKPEDSIPTSNYYMKEFCNDDRDHLTSVRT